MKKLIMLIMCGAVFLTGTSISAAASDTEEDLSSYSGRIMEQIGEAADEDTRQMMRENGAESGSLSEITPGRLAEMLFDEISSSVAEPLRVLAKLTAVLILMALAGSLAQGALSSGFSVISCIACAAVIYKSVYGAFSGVCEFLDKLSAFMLSYIPVYASVCAASGRMTAGGSYYASALGICELIGFASRSVVMPFLSLFMALSFTAAVNPDMHFSEAAASVKNSVKIALTALMTVFTGLTSLKSIAGAAADSAASRAVKFGASSFIPIIGSSVSEAYSAVYAGAGVIRSAAGTAGIAAAGFMLLKPLVTLLLVRVTLGAAGLVSDMLGLKEPSELLKSTGYAMSAAVSTVLCFSMMFIISTAVLMLAAGGGQ